MNRQSGVGFLGFLTLIFITLKLTDAIEWPWIWVLSPLWLPATVILFILFLGFIIFSTRESQKTRK